MARFDKTMKCLTCDEGGDDQPEFFWKRTMILSSVDRWGVYVKGAVPAKRQVAYICPKCEDLVRLMGEANAYAGVRPETHRDDDDGQPRDPGD